MKERIYVKWLWFLVLCVLSGCAQTSKKTAWPFCSLLRAEPETVTVGYSVKNRPVEMYRFGRSPKTVLVIGGIHGNETTGSAVVFRLLDFLKDHPEFYQNQSLLLVPATNPDGLAAGTRLNAHQVDLNRNFPVRNWKRTRHDNSFGVQAPGSEPEVTAVIKVIEEYHPDRILTMHSIDRRYGNNYDGPAGLWARAMSQKNGYQVLKNMGYPTPGSLGSWAGVDRQIPIITLELPRSLPADDAWDVNREALLAFLTVEGAESHPY